MHRTGQYATAGATSHTVHVTCRVDRRCTGRRWEDLITFRDRSASFHGGKQVGSGLFADDAVSRKGLVVHYVDYAGIG